MTEILGILGLQGWGKTALTTGFGYLAFLNGFKVYSNFPLSFDYTPIESLDQAKKVRNGYLLFDEFWRWVHARTSQSNINKEMMGICLLNRKRNVSIIYNTQLPRTIDVILRDVTNYRYLPHMVRHKDNKKYVHYIMRDLLDRESDEMFYNMPIDELGKLFNTRYEVKNIDADKDKTPLEKGIGLEQDFAKAIAKVKGVNHVDLIPNSGNGSSWCYDVIAYTNIGTYAFDVKGAKSRVYLTEYGKNLIKKINNAKQHNAKSYLAFPNLRYKRLSMPQAWFIYQLTNDCYIKRLSHYPSYNKLKNNSDNLKNINFNKK